MVLGTVELGALNPQELVVLLVAVGGLFLLAVYHRRTSRSIAIAYGFLLVGAIATNLENLFWYERLNLIEHAVGNMGAGIAFAIVAYVHRDKLIGVRNDADAEG